MAPINLKGRVLFVTGASAGIGRATALAAARAGMDLALFARRRERLEEVAAAAAALGRRALVAAGDVADEGRVGAAVAEAARTFGRLDAVLANAGYGTMQPAADTPPAAQRPLFEVNYWGTVYTLQAAVPILRRQGHGHLLVTASVAGKVGLPWYGPYSATKAAQDALATALRLELEPEGIRVSSIYPVGTATEFHEVSARLAGRPGVYVNTPRLFQQSADRVAARIVACLRRPVPEVWPSLPARLLVAAATLWPGLAVLLLRGHTRRGSNLQKARMAQDRHMLSS